MIFKFLLKFALVIFLGGLLSSCEPPAPEGPSLVVQAGTVASYKISGHLYKAEVTHADEGYVLWEFSWKKTPVFKLKLYRGILSVFNEEEGYKTWSKFDTNLIDEFFPLEIGNELALEGHHYTKGNEEGYPFFVTINIREKTEIAIKEEIFPVYILEFSFIEEHPDGTKTYTKTAWYSEEMEISLRTDYVMENGTFSMRIVALEELEGVGDENEEQPEGLGTVRL
ncbi:MAG: hypothetical protein V3R64_09670 [Sphingomonadales bacterium]